MNFDRLTMGERIVLGAGLLLILDLLFFPWHHIDILGIGSINRRAVQSPNSFYGVVALLVTIVMVAQVIVSKLTTAKLPDIPVSWGQVHLIAGISVLALLLLKLIVETDALGFGSYLGVLLAAGLAYGGYMINKETTPNRPAGDVPRL